MKPKQLIISQYYCSPSGNQLRIKITNHKDKKTLDHFLSKKEYEELLYQIGIIESTNVEYNQEYTNELHDELH